MSRYRFYTDWKDYYKTTFAARNKIIVNQEVIDFIHKFTSASDVSYFDIEDHFLNGACYWFAVILSNRFKDHRPVIWYDNVNNHFITEIDKVLYDAAGPYIPTDFDHLDYDNFYIWHDYINFDPKHAERITKQCINYEE